MSSDEDVYPAAALDAIRFFPEQKRLERLEEERG
jgi:hypothetical protein